MTVEEAQQLYLDRLAEYTQLEQMFSQELRGIYRMTVNGRTYCVGITAGQ